MTTCRSWTAFCFILLFVILPSEVGLAADVDLDLQACIKPCPRSPNCVSSLERDKRHAIEPIVYTGTLEDACEAPLGVLKAQPRVTLIASEPDSIHAEFKSRWFGFVDDVVFYFPAGQQVIHVRSASRTGYYDFGVNRKRIEHTRLWHDFGVGPYQYPDISVNSRFRPPKMRLITLVLALKTKLKEFEPWHESIGIPLSGKSGI